VTGGVAEVSENLIVAITNVESPKTKIITHYLVFSGGHAHITIRRPRSLAQEVTLLACIRGSDRQSWMTGSVNILFSPSMPVTFHVISNSSLKECPIIRRDPGKNVG